MDRFARNLNDLQRQVHRLADKGVTIEFCKRELNVYRYRFISG